MFGIVRFDIRKDTESLDRPFVFWAGLCLLKCMYDKGEILHRLEKRNIARKVQSRIRIQLRPLMYRVSRRHLLQQQKTPVFY